MPALQIGKYATALVVLLYATFVLPMLSAILIRIGIACGCSCCVLVMQRLTTLGVLQPRRQVPATANQIRALPEAKYRPGMFAADNSKCAICMTDYSAGTAVRVLPCDARHHFCKGCIDEWLRQSASCPVCRASMLATPPAPPPTTTTSLATVAVAGTAGAEHAAPRAIDAANGDAGAVAHTVVAVSVSAAGLPNAAVQGADGTIVRGSGLPAGADATASAGHAAAQAPHAVTAAPVSSGSVLSAALTGHTSSRRSSPAASPGPLLIPPMHARSGSVVHGETVNPISARGTGGGCTPAGEQAQASPVAGERAQAGAAAVAPADILSAGAGVGVDGQAGVDTPSNASAVHSGAGAMPQKPHSPPTVALLSAAGAAKPLGRGAWHSEEEVGSEGPGVAAGAQSSEHATSRTDADSVAAVSTRRAPPSAASSDSHEALDPESRLSWVPASVSTARSTLLPSARPRGHSDVLTPTAGAAAIARAGGQEGAALPGAISPTGSASSGSPVSPDQQPR